MNGWRGTSVVGSSMFNPIKTLGDYQLSAEV
jgi:hypothetical protein